MNQIYVNGHSIMVKGNNLIIDGKLVDVKLKRSLFGGTSIVSSGGTIVNSFVSGAIVSNLSSNANSKIKIGRNTIVLKGDKITVNGKEVNFKCEKPVESKSLKEELNDNARKYLISTIKEDEIEVDGEVCRRIIAMEDIFDKKGTVIVKKGVKGGYIQSRDNLSEEGLCWIYDDAVVFQDAKVKGSAKVSNTAVVCGNATVGGCSQVSQKATIHGNVSIGENAQISGNANVHGNVSIGGNAQISGNADVHGNVSIFGNVSISGNADVHGNVSLSGNVRILGNADLHGSIALSDDEEITNNRQVQALFEKSASGLNSITINKGRCTVTGRNNSVVNDGVIIGDINIQR